MKVNVSVVPSGARSPWMVIVVGVPATGVVLFAGAASPGKSVFNWAAMVWATKPQVAGV